MQSMTLVADGNARENISYQPGFYYQLEIGMIDIYKSIKNFVNLKSILNWQDLEIASYQVKSEFP